jgi:hypothetical protein
MQCAMKNDKNFQTSVQQQQYPFNDVMVQKKNKKKK